MRYFLLALLFTTPIWAQGRPPVPSEKPFVTVTSKSFQFHSFEDDHGGFYLVWQAEGMSLKAQHLNTQGVAVWTEAGKTLTSGPVVNWEAAPDAKGGLLVTWDDPSGSGIYAKRIGPDGEPAWPSKSDRLSISTSTQAYPTVVPDGSGGAVVIWQEKRLPTRWVLMSQHLNALGAPLWTSQGSRVSLRPSNQQFPRAVYDGVAGVVVAWQDVREEASQIQAQRLNYQGTRLWGDQGIVITAPAGDPGKPPFLAAVGGGSAVFAWQAPSAGSDRIFLQLVTASGKFGWNGPGIELTAGTWHEWNPVLHGDGQGGVWIGWEDYRNNDNWTIFVKHILVSGLSGWPSNESRVTTFPSGQGRLGLTDDGQRGILTAWVDNRNGTNNIYFQQIDANGQALLGEEAQLIMTRLGNPRAPQVLSLAPDNSIIVWADNPSKGTWSLYWKKLLPAGRQVVPTPVKPR